MEFQLEFALSPPLQCADVKLEKSHSQSARERGPLLALAVIVATAAVLYALANWIVLDAGNLIKADDHLLINEIARNVLRGDFAVQAEINGNLIGTEDHFTPTFFLIVPFYLVLDHVSVLLLVLSLLIAAGAIPIFLLGRHWGGPRFGLMVAAFYVLLPETLGHALSGMWQQTPAWVLGPLVLYGYVARRWPLYVVASLLLLGTFEDTFLLLGGIGLLALVERREPKWWLFAILASLSWVAFVELATDNFGGGRAVNQVAPEILVNLFSLATAINLGKFALFLTPLLWLGGLRPRFLIPAVGPLWLAAAYIRGDAISQLPGSNTAHYFVESLPFFYVAAVAGAARLRNSPWLAAPRRQRAAVLAAVAVLALFSLRVFASPQQWRAFRESPETTAFKQLTADLPEDVRFATNMPVAYLLDGKAAAAIEFAGDFVESEFILKEHFWDWPALRDFQPRLYAYQTQRAKHRLGGIGVSHAGRRDGTFVLERIERVFRPDPYALAAGDFDGDGRNEVFAGTIDPNFSPSVGVFAIEKRRLVLLERLSAPRKITRLTVGADSPPSIVVDARTEIHWWNFQAVDSLLSPAKKTRQPDERPVDTTDGLCPPPQGAVAVASGDLDGDGNPECVVGYPEANTVTILTPTGEDLGKVITGPFPTAIVCLDVDGDGRDEIITPLHSRVYGTTVFFNYLARHDIDTMILKDAPSTVLGTYGWSEEREIDGVSHWLRHSNGYVPR